MKLSLFLSVLFFQISILASTIEVVGACSETPKFISENIAHDSTKALGDLTIEVFDQNKIPYRGTREGIAQIFNSATGDDAIEVISDMEARFYGWCVHVDGVEPGLMPDQVVLTNPNSKITWFYAYALIYKNEWKEMCVPAYAVKSKKFCHEE